MKRTLTYTILAIALAACSNDAPEPATDGSTDQYVMRFTAVTSGLSRSTATGIYKEDTYPVNRLYLTAFHTDKANTRQYYFEDMELNYNPTTMLWAATDWYWPLQGTMGLMSYWCPAISGRPGIDKIKDADDNPIARMVIDGTTLDGMTDFLYLRQTVECPQTEPVKLWYEHGLAWLDITMRAEVRDANDEVDKDKTDELIDHIKIHKVVIEDCARKGIAYVVPGVGIDWKTYDDRNSSAPPTSYIRDQVYYKEGSGTDISSYQWVEKDKNSNFTPDADKYITLPKLTVYTGTSDDESYLGIYTPTATPAASYIGSGLLIVPQSRTAITMDYTVIPRVGEPVHKVERYELRDNEKTWQSGYHYKYDIIFKNYEEYGANFEVVGSWSGVNYDERHDGYCYDDSVFGTLGYSSSETSIVPDPMHDAGSGSGDDMDYKPGLTVF